MHNDYFGTENVFSEKGLAQLEQYYELLMDWNQRLNLTALTEKKEVFIKHFLDSVQVCFLPEWKETLHNKASVVDVGTGAGFPGIPLAILCSNIKFTLCDALAKRLKFIETVVGELELNNVEVVHSRAEDLGRNYLYRHQFDACVSRAVAKLNVLLEFMCPLVKMGGVAFAYKGPMVTEEMPEGIRCAEIVGGRIVETYPLTLPQGYGERTIIAVKQVRETPKKYPRKAGVPQKDPLG